MKVHKISQLIINNIFTYIRSCFALFHVNASMTLRQNNLCVTYCQLTRQKNVRNSRHGSPMHAPSPSLPSPRVHLPTPDFCVSPVYPKLALLPPLSRFWKGRRVTCNSDDVWNNMTWWRVEIILTCAQLYGYIKWASCLEFTVCCYIK